MRRRCSSRGIREGWNPLAATPQQHPNQRKALSWMHSRSLIIAGDPLRRCAGMTLQSVEPCSPAQAGWPWVSPWRVFRAGASSNGTVGHAIPCGRTRNADIHSSSPWPVHTKAMCVRGFATSPAAAWPGVDLVAGGGPPYQPFSMGGKHRAFNDHRDMFRRCRSRPHLRPAPSFSRTSGPDARVIPPTSSTSSFSLNGQKSCAASTGWNDHLASCNRTRPGAPGRGGGFSTASSPRSSTPPTSACLPAPRAGVHGRLSQRCRCAVVLPARPIPLDALLHDQWVSGDYWGAASRCQAPPPEMPRITPA